jgi:hypothetical protein
MHFSYNLPSEYSSAVVTNVTTELEILKNGARLE